MCVNLANSRNTTYTPSRQKKQTTAYNKQLLNHKRDVKDKGFYSHGLPIGRALIPRHSHHPYLRNPNQPAISTIQDVRTPHKMSGHYTKCQDTTQDVRTPYEMSP